MSKVHLFPLITNVYSDTRLPLQYPGNSQPPAASQVAMSTLLTWIEANLNITNGSSATIATSTYTFNIPAGKWLMAVAAESATAQTFKCGLTAGTDELIYEGIVGAGGISSFSMNIFGGTAGKTIYFSALSGTVTLSFLTL